MKKRVAPIPWRLRNHLSSSGKRTICDADGNEIAFVGHIDQKTAEAIARKIVQASRALTDE